MVNCRAVKLGGMVPSGASIAGGAVVGAVGVGSGLGSDIDSVPDSISESSGGIVASSPLSLGFHFGQGLAG